MSEPMALHGVQDRGWTRERIDLVKRTVCPKGISDDEFALFIEQCKRSGLDPLIKEAFCVPRRKNIGSKESPKWITSHEFQPSEGGMLARAERFDDYQGVMASAVYTEDAIIIDAGAGTVSHTYNPKKRGTLFGAWARLQRNGMTPIVVWLDLAAYAQNTATWGKMPATMIEKCSRVATLRKGYPGPFSGLYIREEIPEEPVSDTPALPAQTGQVSTGSRTAQVKAQLAAKTSSLVVDVASGETEEQATARIAASLLVPVTTLEKVTIPAPEAGPNSPKPALPGPATGVTPYQRILATGKRYGKDKEAVAKWIKTCCPGKVKQKDLTDEDAMKIEEAMCANALQPPGEVAKPVADDDVPF